MAKRREHRGWIRLLVAGILVGMALWGMNAAYQNFCRAAYPQRYEAFVEQYTQEYGVDKFLVYAVIKAESDFRTQVVSVDDACGLMQMLPETLEWIQKLEPGERKYVREDLFLPEVSIRYGVFFLSWLMQEFSALESVVAAYHAGAGAVNGWLAETEYSSDGVGLDRIPYPDTAEYVKCVLECYAMYQSLYAE